MTDEERGLIDAVRGGVAADLSIYADWLDDHPDAMPLYRLPLSHALRWCAARGKRPRRSPRALACSWRAVNAKKRGLPAEDQLPRLVFDQLTMGTERRGRRTYGAHGGWPAFMTPYVFLGMALERLRRAYECSP